MPCSPRNVVQLHVCSLGNAKSASKGRCPAAHKLLMHVALHDNCLVTILLKHKLTELSLARRHGQGCSITGTLYSKGEWPARQQDHCSHVAACKTKSQCPPRPTLCTLYAGAAARSIFSSEAARRAPGSSPADLPRPVKQGSDGTRKASKAVGIGSLAMSPQNSGKLAGKHHCSLHCMNSPVILTAIIKWQCSSCC